jgi:hypothetical protein
VTTSVLAASSTHTLSDISHLPWWAQFAIGPGLVALAAGLRVVDKKLDNGFVDAASFFAGIAGLIVLCNVLF